MILGCCSCRNLDAKKKLNNVVIETAFMCKENKSYVLRCYSECDKFAKASRHNDSCDKIYRKGKNFYNDETSSGTYITIVIILLVILIIVFIFNHDLFDK